MTTNIHPIKESVLQPMDKAKLLGHKGLVIWMLGLSGSGKSTIAKAVEKALHEKGVHSKLLDGDNLRTGINNNLGFKAEDRIENIRRAAEVSKLFLENSEVVICSLISPTKAIRAMAKEIIGVENFREVYINAPFELCAQRDVKGLYKKALAGEIKNFTGLDAPFEAPDAPFLELKTGEQSVEECTQILANKILAAIKL